MDSPVPVRPAGNGPEGETGTTVRYQKTGGFLKPEGALIPPPKDAVQHRMGVEVHSGNQIVIFYGSNSWAYTRLGHIDLSEQEMRDLLSGGDVTITLEK